MPLSEWSKKRVPQPGGQFWCPAPLCAIAFCADFVPHCTWLRFIAHCHHVGTTSRKKYTFKRFQCIQCFTALFRFKTTVGHSNIVGPILQWRFKKIHAPLTFCVHDLCVHGMCMACAWHVHDVCLPVMCLVCAWCVPGVCPDTVISTPPPTPPHTCHAGTTTHTTAMPVLQGLSPL